MNPSLNQVVAALARHPAGRFASLGKDGRQELGFADMHRRVLAIAAALRERGVAPGGHVGIHAENSLEWLACDLACLALGAVSVPFGRGESWGEPAEMIAEWRLDILLTDAWPSGERVLDIASLPRTGGAGIRPHRYRPGDCSTVKFSSGSSARPKAILASVAHFDHMAHHIATMFPIAPGDLFLAIAPLSTWLQRFMVHLSILAGADVTLARPETAINALARERPTFVIGVPRLLEALYMLDRQRRDPDAASDLTDLWGGRLRYLWTGSAPMDRRILDAYVAAGIPLFEGYGMSETGMIAKNHPGSHRPGSVGRAFPGKRVAIGADGQIMVQSEFHANTRYWRGEGEAFQPSGWVATGDVGHLDADGYLYVDGRLKETIVLSNGHKIFPGAIEELLRAHPGIADCAVTCHAGAHLVALVQTVDPAMSDGEVAGALAAVSATLPAHGRLFDFARLDGISVENGLRTANGKLKRGAVADYYAGLVASADG